MYMHEREREREREREKEGGGREKEGLAGISVCLYTLISALYLCEMRF